MAPVAVLLWLVLVLTPGLAIVRLLRIPISLLGALAIASPISLGALYLVGELASRAGVPVVSSCLAFVAVLVIGWLAVEIIRYRRSHSDRSRKHPGAGAGAVIGRWLEADAWRSPALACSRALLILAIGAGGILWHALHAHLMTPAGWDAMHHGYFVRQIIQHDTLDPRIVLSSDPARPDGTTSFYPLVANLLTAMLNVSSGIRVSVLILASTIAFAGVLLPLATYYLCLRLAPRLPLVAGFAAVATVLPPRLFTIEYTGRVTAILGVALVPAAVGAFICLGDRIGLRGAVLSGLTIIGMVSLHTSEVPIVVGVVVVIVVVGAWSARRWRPAVWWLGFTAAVGLLAGALLFLVNPEIANLVSERTASFGTPGPPQSLLTALGRFLVATSPDPAGINRPMEVWAIMADVGCALILLPRWRKLGAAAVAYVGSVAVFVLAVSKHLGPLAFVGDAWYQNDQRMLWELMFLGAIPVGVTLTTVAVLVRYALQRLGGGARRKGDAPYPARLRWTAALSGVAVTLACVGTFVRPPVRTVSRWLQVNAAPVNRDSQRAFGYLAQHVHGDERVLDDVEGHGDLWMYIDYNVPTLFGNPPLIGDAPDSWKARLYLRGKLSHIATDGCVSDLLAEFKVTYVYYGVRAMHGSVKRIHLSTLDNTEYFRPVFRSGQVRVFQVLPSSVRPCDANLTTPFPWTTVANSR